MVVAVRSGFGSDCDGDDGGVLVLGVLEVLWGWRWWWVGVVVVLLVAVVVLVVGAVVRVEVLV